MRLVSWNVAGRVRMLPEQAGAIGSVSPDVVCLQEITTNAAALWEDALRSLGYTHVSHPAPWGRETGRTRRLAVLTASRWPMRAQPLGDMPWPERVLSVLLPDGLEIVNVHSPISSTAGLVKVRTHEAVAAYLRGRGEGRCVLCGDLNTPRKEHPDGRVWTFARDRYGRLRPERGARWDEAELALVRGLASAGFRDAFRELHGYERRALSWEWPKWGGGYRLDHLIVSQRVQATRCEYLHDWRLEGLSDHSALLAEVA